MIAREREAGMTLTEVMVVIILAAVVMTGLTVFYLNSQALWIDGSAQAITQRELALALRAIGKHAHSAAIATTMGDPHHDLQLRLDVRSHDPDSAYCFWLRDSLIHEGYPLGSNPATRDLGPVMQSRVEAFAVRTDMNMVYIDSIRVLTPKGDHLTMGTSVALKNWITP